MVRPPVVSPGPLDLGHTIRIEIAGMVSDPFELRCHPWPLCNTYHALQFLESGAYNRVEFPLAPEAIAALQGTHSDCRFSFEIASDPVLGGIIFDAGGFVQGGSP